MNARQRLAFAALLLSPILAPAQAAPPVYRVTATGQSQSDVQPNRAEIRMDVQQQAATVDPAKQRVDEAVNNVLAALQKLNLPEHTVSASGITIVPQYDQSRPDSYSSGKLQGYIVTRDVVVRLRELDRLAAVIAAVTDAGVNSIPAITYRLDESDEQEATIAVQRQALESARGQALAAAQQAGARLGQAVTINLSSPPLRFGGAMAVMAKASAAQYEPGPLTVTAQATVEYELLYPGKPAVDELPSAVPPADEQLPEPSLEGQE